MKWNTSSGRHQAQRKIASDLRGKLSCNLQRVMLACQEKGASSWLTALPISDHGFALHKGAFHDEMCLRDG